MMRNYKIWLACMAAILFMGSCQEPTFTLNGKVNLLNETLFVSNPKIPLTFDGFVDTLKVNADGSFQLPLQPQEDRIMLIKSQKQRWFLPLVASHNFQLTLEADGKLTIDGPNAAGILAYQDVAQYDPSLVDWRMYRRADSPKKKLNEDKEQELKPFKVLLEKGEITPHFYDWLEHDRNIYYATIEANLYLPDLKHISRGFGDAANLPHLVQQLSALFQEYNPVDLFTIHSPTWHAYALNSYVEGFLPYDDKKVTKDNVDELGTDTFVNFYWQALKRHFKQGELEAVMALFIYQLSGVNRSAVSTPAIRLYKEFVKRFPNSAYTHYFRDHMERTLAYYENETINEAVHILNESYDINSVEELFTLFKGQQVYVDFWAMWCGPCRAQFQFAAPLHDILKANNTTPLYISLDKEDKQEDWKALINILNLEGYHYRATKAFQADLAQKLLNSPSSSDLSLTVPWYMLVSAEGNIVEERFKSPEMIVADGGW